MLKKPLQRIIIKNILFFLSSICFTPYLSAQTSDMLKKAQSMGITEEMIKSQLGGNADISDILASPNNSTDKGLSSIFKNDNKGTLGSFNTLSASELDRERQKLEDIIAEKEVMKKRQDSIDKMVFGREIFTSAILTFEPDYNMPTPVDYKFAANDEVIIDVWGASEANYQQKISPDGTIYLKDAGLIHLAGLTVPEAEQRIYQRLSQIYSGLEEGDGSVHVKLSLGQIRSIKVNIVGEAEVPGTYTLPSVASLFNALYAAKGINEIGTLRDIKVYRDNKEIATLDIYDYLLNGKLEGNIRLQDNDIIIIGPYQNLATINGKIKRNRIFELKKGETLADLIRYAGNFTGDAYTDNLQVYRKNGSRYQIYTVENDNFPGFQIQDGDSIHVGQTIQMYENRIAVKGAIWRPGNYELSERTNTVGNLIKTAEGLKGDAFTSRAQITRMRPDFTFEVIPLNLKAILNGEEPDIPLQAEDEIYIPSVHELKENYYILVRGEVNKAPIEPKNTIDYIAIYNEKYKDVDLSGIESQDEFAALVRKLEIQKVKKHGDHLDFDYTTEITPEITRSLSDTIQYRENMTIADAILLAGGLKESASEAKIMVARRIKDPKATAFTNQTAQEFEFSINKDLTLDPTAASFILEPFDEIYVRRSPGYQQQQIVNIGGEVLFPGEYVITSRGERLSDLVAKSGGVTPDAYIKGANLRRMKTISDLAREETLAKLAIDANTTTKNDTIAYDKKTMYTVGIDLEAALANPGGENDLVLQEGDVLVIPEKLNTVKINGAVLYPNTVTYQNKNNIKDYISQAGGYVERARKRPYVIYMNGHVTATRNGFFYKRYPKIEPGCEIVVPMKSANRRTMGAGEVVSMLNSAVSMAAMITSITK